MPYKVIAEEVSVLERVGDFTDEHGNLQAHDHQSVTYLMDDVIPDEKVSPIVVKKYDEGDKHTRSLLVRVDDKGKEVDERPVVEEAQAEEPAVVSKGDTTGTTQTRDTGEKIVKPATEQKTEQKVEASAERPTRPLDRPTRPLEKK